MSVCATRSHTPHEHSIAEFWVSRAVVNATGQASIDNVIGPDEYHDHVNNRCVSSPTVRSCMHRCNLGDRLGGTVQR